MGGQQLLPGLSGFLLPGKYAALEVSTVQDSGMRRHSVGVVICCHGATQSSSTSRVCESFMDPAYMTSQRYKMSSMDAVARVSRIWHDAWISDCVFYAHKS
ncbi:hypothetical protein KL921_005437, partial [Ogataea angusta]